MTPSIGTDGPTNGRARAVRALLFDRDGTLVEDVPYNAAPAKVRPLPTAAEALRSCRVHGWKVGVVTNQSGIARGLLSVDDLARVHRRLDVLLGPFDVVEWCPHGPTDGCSCRKPAPGLVLRAAAALGLRADECVVIGDRMSDVLAARAAGARGIRIGDPGVPDVLAAVRLVQSAEHEHEHHHRGEECQPEERHGVIPSPGTGR